MNEVNLKKRLPVMDISCFLQEMRPKQWIKNLLLFSPLIFSGRLFHIASLGRVAAGFVCFSFIASSVYIVNDLLDLQSDRLHPLKKFRPLASGELSVFRAAWLGMLLFCLAVFFGFYLKTAFGAVLLMYALINIVYSKILKHMIILDVLLLSFFLLIRVMAGALLINVEASDWLLICTFMLATFLGFAKRRHELLILEEEAQEHRKVLKHYELYFLDQMIAVVTASTVISYILYTISEETLHKFGTRNLIYTTPFVLYGIFRYLYLIHRKNEGGDPALVVLSDKGMIINIFLWGLTAIAVIYLRGYSF